MKKSIYLVALGVLFSCVNDSTESKEQDRKQIITEKSRAFIENKIKKDETVLTLKSLHVDSLMPMSTLKLEFTKLTPLRKELQNQIKLTEDLQEIDSDYGGTTSQVTKSAFQKFQKLNDSVTNEIGRIKKLPDNDTVGYAALVKIDIVLKDGTVAKDKPIELYFDLDNDMRSDWNKHLK